MLLIQAPVLFHGNPVEIHLIKHAVQSFHCTFQIGSIGFIEIEAIFSQRLPCLLGFGNSFFRKVYIRPAGETIFLVPYTLSVTK